ncbi:MAG: sigma 54-interacting transcriptional regulator [Pseudobdellovibrionaceae bacterium]
MTDFGLFQTVDAQMKRVLETAQSMALTPAPILISGESGSGKSLLVQFLVEKSRLKKPLLRWGREEQTYAEGDWVLIEGLDDLNLYQQQMLSEKMDELKLQNKKIRWIATSNENPSILVRNQKLRRDLFFRLSVIHLQIPALRDRSQDVLVLARFFNQVFNLMKSRTEQALSAETQAKLLAYSWPGNVAELENVMERAVAISKGDEISVESIEFSQMGQNILPSMGTTLSEMERKLILQTLQLTQQNKTRAAQILGISIRTLRNKLNEYREAGIL